MNARVVVREIKGVVGRYGVPSVNESGDRLLYKCLEQKLAVCNSFFSKIAVN